MAAPVLEFRSASAPYGLLSLLNLTGSGVGGAISIGSTSNPATLRIYNNFAGAGSVGTAYNIVLASYDSEATWGSMTTEPITGTWLQVKVLDYDGSTSGADITYFAIGGAAKHAAPVNGGQIAANVAHYMTISTQVSIPSTTGLATGSQGLWVEYTWI